MQPNTSILSLTHCLIASAPGANNLRGSYPSSKSFPASMYLRVASWKYN